MSPYRIVFGKACHFPLRYNTEPTGRSRSELCLEVHENSRIYKKKVKQFHDNRVLRKEFRVRQKLIAGKFRSRWDRPFVISNVFPFGTVEFRGKASNRKFKIKPYYEGPSSIVCEVERISLMELAILEDTLEEISKSSYVHMH
ncbi:hypothetical protein CR513_14303, partial [Mucuna pruriens]